MSRKKSPIVSIADWRPWDVVGSCVLTAAVLAVAAVLMDDDWARWGTVAGTVGALMFGFVFLFDHRTLLVRGDTLIYVSQLTGSTEWRRGDIHRVALTVDHPYSSRRRKNRASRWFKTVWVVLDRYSDIPIVLATPGGRSEKERIVLALREWHAGSR